jgi:hypothetical protein
VKLSIALNRSFLKQYFKNINLEQMLAYVLVSMLSISVLCEAAFTVEKSGATI